jgi:transposase
MFFRLKHSPSGQCLQLLEAYRNAQGQPRHRVVVSLGDASVPVAEQTAIARAVERKLGGQVELFSAPLSPAAQPWVDTILKRIEREGRLGATPPAAALAGEPATEAPPVAEVLLDEVTHTHTTALGPSLVGLAAWRRLEMPRVLEQLGFNPAQAQAAAISVIQRLVSPGSERALLEWLPNSSLPELLDLQVTDGIKDRFYRVSDQLLKHQAALEKHLRDRQGELFGLERTVLLYDLTNSYFEGEALGNPKARRGRSKEKRHDCPQIVVGMVFDRRGLELAHKVFAGNQSDGKSLVTMIQELEALVQAEELPVRDKPLVIVDAGVATRANLRLLRRKGFEYLVNDSRRGRTRYRAEFAQESAFELIGEREGQPAVKVRRIVDPYPPQAIDEEPPDAKSQALREPMGQAGPTSPPELAADQTDPTPDPPDDLILCRSEGRQQKETGIRSQAEDRYLAALAKLAQRVATGKLKEVAKIQRAIGRLQQSHTRVQRFYQVEYQAGKTPTAPGTVHWTRLEAPYQADEQLLGCYVLRTNQGGQTAAQAWELYTVLSQAEAGFRAIKGDLGLRPNFHQTEARVDAHVFISVLAYHLLWFILQSLQAVGDHRCWQTLKRVLETHAYTTILLPTQGGKLYRLRRAGEPEEGQKAIYETLKVDWKHLPQSRVLADRNNATTL